MLLQVPDSPSPKKQKKNKKKTVQRFRWEDKKLEFLIKCLAGVKADYEFRGIDFESDLTALYSDAGAKMAKIDNKNNVRPVEETSMALA